MLFENSLQTVGIWKRRVFAFMWTENVLKTELFDNDVVTISLPLLIYWMLDASQVQATTGILRDPRCQPGNSVGIVR